MVESTSPSGQGCGCEGFLVQVNTKVLGIQIKHGRRSRHVQELQKSNSKDEWEGDRNSRVLQGKMNAREEAGNKARQASWSSVMESGISHDHELVPGLMCMAHSM